MKWMLPKAAVALLLLSVATNAAQDESNIIELNGVAEPICGFTAPASSFAGTNLAITSAGTVSSTVTINDMIDDNTAFLKPSSISINYQAVCNFAHNLKIESVNDGLFDSNPVSVVSSGFLTNIKYSSTIEWDGVTNGLVTTGTNSTVFSPVVSVGGANVGNLKILINISGGNNPLNVPVVAGYYTDTLKIHIGSLI